MFSTIILYGMNKLFVCVAGIRNSNNIIFPFSLKNQIDLVKNNFNEIILDFLFVFFGFIIKWRFLNKIFKLKYAIKFLFINACCC